MEVACGFERRAPCFEIKGGRFGRRGIKVSAWAGMHTGTNLVDRRLLLETRRFQGRIHGGGAGWPRWAERCSRPRAGWAGKGTRVRIPPASAGQARERTGRKVGVRLGFWRYARTLPPDVVYPDADVVRVEEVTAEPRLVSCRRALRGQEQPRLVGGGQAAPTAGQAAGRRARQWHQRRDGGAAAG